MVFNTVAPQQYFTLENQNRKKKDIYPDDISIFLEDMFLTPDQFVILTSPTVQHKVRYVQACMQGKDVEVQLGIEENGTHLFHKLCSKKECVTIFMAFFENEFIPNMDEYEPVQF